MIYKMSQEQYDLQRQGCTHNELLDRLNNQLNNISLKQKSIVVTHNNGAEKKVHFNEITDIITDIVTY